MSAESAGWGEDVEGGSKIVGISGERRGCEGTVAIWQGKWSIVVEIGEV